MNERIKNHIELLFETAPKTRKAIELKEELLANSEERYQDLIADGVNPEDAIKNVINSLGNIGELFQGLEDISPDDRTEYSNYIKKAAKFKTVAAGIYIFSLAVLFYFIYLNGIINAPFAYMPIRVGGVNFVLLGIVFAFLIDIIPTCMLVYISSINPRNKRTGDTVVEEFKAWNNNTKHVTSVRNAISGVLWTATLLLYFAISFTTYAWYATWIVFLVAACLQTVIVLIYRIKENN
jgi:hypothetical protein